jgi:hypothetical protein
MELSQGEKKMKTILLSAMLLLVSLSLQAATPQQAGTYQGLETIRIHNLTQDTVTQVKTLGELVVYANNTVYWLNPYFSYSGPATIGTSEGMFSVANGIDATVPFQFKGKGVLKGAYTANVGYGYIESKYTFKKQ